MPRSFRTSSIGRFQCSSQRTHEERARSLSHLPHLPAAGDGLEPSFALAHGVDGRIEEAHGEQHQGQAPRRLRGIERLESELARHVGGEPREGEPDDPSRRAGGHEGRDEPHDPRRRPRSPRGWGRRAHPALTFAPHVRFFLRGPARPDQNGDRGLRLRAFRVRIAARGLRIARRIDRNAGLERRGATRDEGGAGRSRSGPRFERPEWIPREEIASGKLVKRVSSVPAWIPREEIGSGQGRQASGPLPVLFTLNGT
jgi:hypothetical protein